MDCGDGSACVVRTEDNDCISEGIGYGMLLTAAFDDQEAFDKLWQYFKNHRRQSGMMNWQTNVCGDALSDGAATDGDLDAAMALVNAGCNWGGSYAQDAQALIDAMEGSAIANCTSGSVLMPGDNFGGCAETNPSYVAPAYYRIFQQITGNAVWADLIDSGYDLLAANQARKEGVFSDWSDEAGALATAGNHSDDFGPDASRVPWRVVTDYIWNGEPRAASILDAFRARVTMEGGPQRAFVPNSMFRGAAAFSAMVTDAATARESTEAWLLTAVDDETYFPGTLRPLYLLLAAGQFTGGCD
jgi:endo-1,4-beta-D-glucanase Y